MFTHTSYQAANVSKRGSLVLRSSRRMGMHIAAAVVLLVASLAPAAPAMAYGSKQRVEVHMYYAIHFQNSVGRIRHWDMTPSGTKVGGLAWPGQTSDQGICWVGVTAYGAAAV